MFEVKVSFLFECRRYMPGELLADDHPAIPVRSQFVKPAKELVGRLEVRSASNTFEEVAVAPAKTVPSPKTPAAKAPIVSKPPVGKPPVGKAPATKVGAPEV